MWRNTYQIYKNNYQHKKEQTDKNTKAQMEMIVVMARRILKELLEKCFS